MRTSNRFSLQITRFSKNVIKEEKGINFLTGAFFGAIWSRGDHVRSWFIWQTTKKGTLLYVGVRDERRKFRQTRKISHWRYERLRRSQVWSSLIKLRWLPPKPAILDGTGTAFGLIEGRREISNGGWFECGFEVGIKYSEWTLAVTRLVRWKGSFTVLSMILYERIFACRYAPGGLCVICEEQSSLH